MSYGCMTTWTQHVDTDSILSPAYRTPGTLSSVMSKQGRYLGSCRSMMSAMKRVATYFWILVITTTTSRLLTPCAALRISSSLSHHLKPPSSSQLDHSYSSAVEDSVVSAAWWSRATRRQHEQKSRGVHERVYQLPAEDETFSVLQTLKELWAGPGTSEARQARYDNMVNSTGGVWRSRLLGLFPLVVSCKTSATFVCNNLCVLFCV